MISSLKLPGTRELPRNTPKTSRSRMETMILTIPGIDRWKRPPFQRPLQVTPKVVAVSVEIKDDGGIIPGVITLGEVDSELFLLDGQHRMEAFRLSGLEEGLADVRIRTFETMGEMGEEFTKLNSPLVRMRNDDFLRGMEESNPHIASIRKRCPFIGYSKSPKVVLTVANAIRVWFGSDGITPVPGPATLEAAKMLDAEQVSVLCDFLNSCYSAWGTDVVNQRLWSSLNLGILMWLWRRLVLGAGLTSTRQFLIITKEQFSKCLITLSANVMYVEWLRGRSLRERDRSPCYDRIRRTFVIRLGEMEIKKVRFPQEDWTKS